MGELKYHCWKYSVLAYVIFFCVTGIAELATISYILLRRYSLRFFVGSLRVSLYSSYAAPFLLAATAALGWNAVCNRQKNVLKVFSILMAAIVCVEISFCVWSFMEKEDLGRSATNVLVEVFPRSGVNSSEEWDTLQTQLKCCGIHESSDYTGNIPKSCSDITPQGKVVHPKGCLYPLMEILADDFNLASVIFLSMALAQLPGVFLAWCLSNRIVGLAINPF